MLEFSRLKSKFEAVKFSLRLSVALSVRLILALPLKLILSALKLEFRTTNSAFSFEFVKSFAVIVEPLRAYKS